MEAKDLLPILLVALPFGAIALFFVAMVIKLTIEMWKDLGK